MGGGTLVARHDGDDDDGDDDGDDDDDGDGDDDDADWNLLQKFKALNSVLSESEPFFRMFPPVFA